jgi:hypothetical protein
VLAPDGGNRMGGVTCDPFHSQIDNNGEGGEKSLHVTNGRVDILKFCILLSHENMPADLRA